MRSSPIPKSLSTTTPSATSTSVTASGASQHESAGGQHRQGSFIGLSTTAHTPESTRISSNYYQQDELRLLSNISASQIDPFEVLATHQAVTFDDRDQGQSASFLSLSNEPSRSQRSSQPVDDVAPIVREGPSPDPTDKWIILTGDKKKPFKCRYEGCGRCYSRKRDLRWHLVRHTGDSPYRCYIGECTGEVAFCRPEGLKRHIRVYHTFEKPYECKICKRRFGRTDHLRSHRERMHSFGAKKKSPKPQHISELSSAATATITASIRTMTFRVSQPELAAWQRQQGSYVGTSTTINTPESRQTAASHYQQDGLRLLAEVSTSQINPFAAHATHQPPTFDDEAVTTGIAGVPNLPSDQYQAEQSSDPTDTNKWIIVDESQKKPFRCGYPGGCDKIYLTKRSLTRHFVKHTGKSKFKCPDPKCVGNEYFGDSTLLKRHIVLKHTQDKSFQCELCDRQFGLQHHLRYHTKHAHGIEEEKKLPNRKKK